MADTLRSLSLSLRAIPFASQSPYLPATPSLPKDKKMLLKPQTSSFSLQTLDLERKTKTRINSNYSVFHSFTSTALQQNVNGVARLSQRFAHNAGASFVGVKASKEADCKRTILDIVFEPFEEVKKELLLVPSFPQASVARHKYTDPCEAAINEQINVEYNVSYVYHALYAYFDRDNVALKGIARFFKESSEEERQHAQKLMEYQNKRGGKVKLQSMMKPMSDYDHLEKGDALYAMELALSLEKLTNEKLVNLHKVAAENDDVQMTDFIESEFLGEQVEAIKKISEYVAQLRMVGKGHGVWHFDQMLLADIAAP